MLINLRNALMSGKRLPYDAEVEFLECAGTSSVFPYIDTGIVGSMDVTVSARIWRSTRSTNECAMGSWDGGNTRCWPLYFNGNKYYLGMGPLASALTEVTSEAWHDIALTKSGNTFIYTADGTVVGQASSTSTFASMRTLYIGAMNNTGKPAFFFRGRFAFVKIYVAGILVRDFIPVRKGTVGYLYDRVSGKLFGNAGTGDFVLGQDVVPVEYLQSSGRQYIDTGVVGYKTTKVESHCALLNANSAYPAMWGARTGSRNNDFQIYYNTPTIGGNPSSIVLRTGNSDKSISTSDIGVNTFIGTRLDIVAADGALSVNGYNFSTPAFSNFTTPHSILMFCEYTANRPVNFGSFVYWGMKMWQADSIVRSFLPVRAGTEGAMMDVLTRRIYRNAGTGAFGYGNDLKYPIPAE